jgi:hypothetical protein
VPTASIRAGLAAVDRTNFMEVQIALLVLMLYFTFQRSELPCPKTYGSLDHSKHLFVRHMQPHEGGTRWAVGVTKADPRAERLSGDAGPGREWIVVGEVDDELFDMRTWLALFYSMLPPGPRDPDSPFFVAADMKRPLIYSNALSGFHDFLRKGGVDDPDEGLHGIRAEAFMTCCGAVTEEAAVIQGGWASRQTASRYDRLTLQVAKSISSKMVAFHSAGAEIGAHDVDAHDGGAQAPPTQGNLRDVGGLGIVTARANARSVGGPRPRVVPQPRTAHQPTSLPAGWTRVWHPTSGRRGGYASYEGPRGLTAVTITAARRLHATAAPARPDPPRAAPGIVDISDHVVYDERLSARRPPRERVV